MDDSPPGSSVYGTFSTRVLEWVPISSSRGSSRLRDQICLLLLLHCRQILYYWATGEAHSKPNTEIRRFAAEKSFMSQSSKETGEEISEILPRREGAQRFCGTRKQGGLRHGEHGERWLEIKRWGNHSVQVWLNYSLLRRTQVQKMVALGWSEWGGFGPVSSRGHQGYTCAWPVGESVVLTCLKCLLGKRLV